MQEFISTALAFLGTGVAVAMITNTSKYFHTRRLLTSAIGREYAYLESNDPLDLALFEPGRMFAIAAYEREQERAERERAQRARLSHQ